jgi:hypothetical protein
MSKKLIHALPTLIVSCAIVCVVATLAVLAIDEFYDDRNTYKPTVVNGDPIFNNRHQGAAWLKDPQQTAIKYLVPEGVDACRKFDVNPVTIRPQDAVIVVTSNCGGDDATSARRYRVELERKGELWDIAWVGWKQKCRRVSIIGQLAGEGGWTTRPCP